MNINCGTDPCEACPVSLLPIAVREPLGDLLQATVSELSADTVRFLSRNQMEAMLQAGNTDVLHESLKGLHRNAAELYAIGATALRKASKLEHN